MNFRRVTIKYISPELWLIRWLPGRRLTWARSPEQAFDKVSDSCKRQAQSTGETAGIIIEWLNVQKHDTDRIHALAKEVTIADNVKPI